MIFKSKSNSLGDIASKAAGNIAFFFDLDPHVRSRIVVPKIIDRSVPWGFFEGACMEIRFDVVGVASFRLGSNNFVELMALRLLLTKAWEWGVHTLQVFGESKNILEWAKGTQNYHILHLRLLLEGVKHLRSLFDLISFVHVYRERNTMADRLSKVGT